ncbi:hypothetical protein FIM1_4843 [Kluyveromyces marxianus]|uniref:Uncharacterized protein n=1 Tax=Kluyveromyces marxianus TaxID=4911 RepID=A0ABX6EZL2_KLUMA|nr:hypothetical protein FIM1_4843 [Kluyveromyces marxianus]
MIIIGYPGYIRLPAALGGGPETDSSALEEGGGASALSAPPTFPAASGRHRLLQNCLAPFPPSFHSSSPPGPTCAKKTKQNKNKTKKKRTAHPSATASTSSSLHSPKLPLLQASTISGLHYSTLPLSHQFFRPLIPIRQGSSSHLPPLRTRLTTLGMTNSLERPSSTQHMAKVVKLGP